jgi:hypothetical protein
VEDDGAGVGVAGSDGDGGDAAVVAGEGVGLMEVVDGLEDYVVAVEEDDSLLVWRRGGLLVRWFL